MDSTPTDAPDVVPEAVAPLDPVPDLTGPVADLRGPEELAAVAAVLAELDAESSLTSDSITGGLVQESPTAPVDAVVVSDGPKAMTMDTTPVLGKVYYAHKHWAVHQALAPTPDLPEYLLVEVPDPGVSLAEPERLGVATWGVLRLKDGSMFDENGKRLLGEIRNQV